MKKTIALLLAAALLLTGCGGAAMSGEDLMKDIKPSREQGLISVPESDPELYEGEAWDNAKIADFGVRLLKESMEAGKNTLISPVSILSALAMTAGGADGNTLTQMEAVLGQSVGALNNWYKYGVPEDDALHLANGIWIKDDPKLTVEEAFLQTNADYYGAGIYKAPFDSTTLKDINGFVEENTKGMVTDILDEIPEEAVLYLVNALAFEAQWQEVYKQTQVHEADFTTESGEKQAIQLMWSEENRYLENDLATGFIKPYQNGRYAFAALLPKEDVTVAELVQSLDGQQLQSLLANPQTVPLNAAIPKFETEYSAQMSEVLASMGMTDAFDYTLADFSRMGSHTDGNLCINRVLHKTFISVAEKGTKAGAATAVEIVEESAAEMEIKNVVLRRPFLYMILDTESNIPVFVGTLMNMGEEAFLLVEPNENGHAHVPAEEQTYPTVGYCGNIVTTVKLDGKEYSFMYDDSVALTDILTNQLSYDPDAVCRCMADITVETELGGPYYVNLEESFARCAEGQAALTEAQIQTLRNIIDRLQ